MLRRQSFYLGNSISNKCNEGRLVTSAAVGDGCQKWRVGFEQNPLGWNRGNHFTADSRVLVRDGAANADVETKQCRAGRQPRRARKGVKHTRSIKQNRFGLPQHPKPIGQQEKEVVAAITLRRVFSFAAVDHCWELQLPRNSKLFTKDRMLHVPRRRIPVTVQSNLADGDDRFRLGQSAEANRSSARPGLAFRGVDPDGGAELRTLLRKPDNCLGRIDTQRGNEHARHAGLEGALNGCIPVLIEDWEVEVAMGICEQG